MSIRSLINVRALSLVSLFILAFASQALAGGFYLSIEVPSKNEPEFKDAVLLVRPYGCHQPTDADVKAMAEGIVNGERRSLPLRLTPTTKGVYTIKQQWPSEGLWVLAINATYRGHISAALVQLEQNGKVNPKTETSSHGKQGTNAQTVARKLTREDIENALQAMANNKTAQIKLSSIEPTKMGIGVGAGAGVAALTFIAWRSHKNRRGI